MATFDIEKEEHGENADLISVSPYWVVVAWPFRRHITFNRGKIQSPEKRSISVSNDATECGAATNPVIMYNECTGLQVGGSKESHITTMSATFKEAGESYMTQVFPGDWCAAWIVYGKDKLKKLLAKIRDGKSCNEFSDGFKFVGRVRSFRKSLIMAGSNKIIGLTLRAASFTEFANQIWYDPNLNQTSVGFSDVLGKMQIQINDLMSMDKNVGVDSNKLIPRALNLVLGSGLPSQSTDPSGQLARSPSPVMAEGKPSATYVVPEQIGKLLGAKARATEIGLYAYADILDVLIGIQKYEDSAKGFGMFAPMHSDPNTNMNILGKSDSSLNVLGSFMPIALAFTNKPLWSLMNEFVNPVCNEMYTAIRVNAAGKVVPTLIVRQHPLSSERLSNENAREPTLEPTANTYPTYPWTPPIPIAGAEYVNKAIGAETIKPGTVPLPPLTRFLELPRWKASAKLMRTFDIGRSDEVGHFNFFHVYGSPVAQNKAAVISAQIGRHPPFSDEDDLRRSGFLPYMSTVDCSVQDAAGDGPEIWMQMAADFYLGQQYMYTGTVSIQGVESPICHGDNFEHDGVVYHIEAYSHSCSVAPTGQKTFITYLTLSHGVSSTPEQGMFPGFSPSDNTADDPGLTGEFEDS